MATALSAPAAPSQIYSWKFITSDAPDASPAPARWGHEGPDSAQSQHNPLHPQTEQTLLIYYILKPPQSRAITPAFLPPSTAAAGKAVDAGMRRGLIRGAALTAPNSHPDLQPRLHFPGKMGFVWWEPTRITGFGNRPCHVSFNK